MDLKNLNANELADIGIVFWTEGETRMFADFIKSEFETRIGKEIAKRAGKEKAKEFENMELPEAEKWLDENVPDYRDIVLQKSAELENELKKYKDAIAGNVRKKVER